MWWRDCQLLGLLRRAKAHAAWVRNALPFDRLRLSPRAGSGRVWGCLPLRRAMSLRRCSRQVFP